MRGKRLNPNFDGMQARSLAARWHEIIHTFQPHRVAAIWEMMLAGQWWILFGWQNHVEKKLMANILEKNEQQTLIFLCLMVNLSENWYVENLSGTNPLTVFTVFFVSQSVPVLNEFSCFQL